MKQILVAFLNVIKWGTSVASKLLKVVPRQTLTIIFATVVSQFSILLAFLLPLKILILLGSPSIPSYFPSLLINLDRNTIVLLLTIISAFFYLVYFISEKIVDNQVSSGAKFLLERNAKISLFHDQEGLAKSSYGRYSKSLAGLFFTFLSLLFILIFYFDLFLFIILSILVGFFTFVFFLAKSESLNKKFERNAVKAFSIASGLCFLVSFLFIVLHFVFGYPPGILVAIVSLIAMRQMYTKLSSVISDYHHMYSRRNKINSLFFHGHHFDAEVDKNSDFWKFLKPANISLWIESVLDDFGCYRKEESSISLIPSAVSDVIVLRVHVIYLSGEEGKLVFKFFRKNKSSYAKQEEIILFSNMVVPAPKLLKTISSDMFVCHVFCWDSSRRLSRKDKKIAFTRLYASLIEVEPDKKLVSSFVRSKPCVWQRVDDSFFEKIDTVSSLLGGNAPENAKLLRSNRYNIVKRLSELPFMVINLQAVGDVFLRQDDDQIFLMNWGHWIVEPIGAGWPVHTDGIEELIAIFNEAKQKRKNFANIKDEDLVLSALVYSLERSISKSDYLFAFRVIPKILLNVGVY